MFARIAVSPVGRTLRVGLAAAATLVGAACDHHTVTANENPKYSIELVSGAEQQVAAGSVLTTPVVLRVVQYGTATPAAGVQVELNVALDDGKLATDPIQTTDAAGQVSFVWQVGTKVRPDSLLVTVPSDGFTAPLVVEEFAIAGAPAQIMVLGGDGQQAAAGAQLPSAIRLEVVDAFGNPVPGVTIRFTDDDNGTFTQSSVTTDDGGVAADQLVLPTTPGVDDITASVTLGDGTVLQVTLHESAQ